MLRQTSMNRFLIAMIASLAAGCIITTGGDDSGDRASITVSWVLTTSATGTVAPCPAGYNTAALYSQEVEEDGTPTSLPPVIDLFNCSDGIGLSDLLPPSFYRETVVITNTDNTMQFAASKTNLDDRVALDIDSTDLTYGTEIIVDGGYFHLAWSLVGATTGSPLSCADANTDTISVTLEDLTTSSSQTQLSACSAGQALTTGVPTGNYTVVVNAFDGNQSVATTTPIDASIAEPAMVQPVTDVGTFTIPIPGM